MKDWLGMGARPVVPRRELRAAILDRARSGERDRGWKRAAAVAAVAAGLVLLTAGAGIAVHRAGSRARGLAARLAAAQDTLRLLRGPGTRVMQIPVRTADRIGSVTVFADTAGRRWYVQCDNLAPNRPGEAYQLWFVTETGMVTAALMPMDKPEPMGMALEVPRGADVIKGAAMSVEPRVGSPAPTGPMLFRLDL
jgi:Anti-sigma-K factor rskA